MTDIVKRPNYFKFQFLHEADFNTEQAYHLTHQRDHARLMHTPGIAEGLEVPNPPSGATAVTVNAGVAFDDRGRRIVLADNQLVELANLPPGQAAYITISFDELPSDPSDETGSTGNTRWTEAPLIAHPAAAPANPDQTLVLARIERSGTAISLVDRSGRRTAGVKGGDLDVRTLTLSSGSIAQSGWVQARLGASGRADVGGHLRVAGDLIVTGSIQGDLAAGTVGTADLADAAVTSAKLADKAVDAAKIADGSVGTAKLVDRSVTGAKITTGTIGTNEIGDGAVTGAKLAANSVDAGKIVDGSVGSIELAADAVTNEKIANATINQSKFDSATSQKIDSALQRSSTTHDSSAIVFNHEVSSGGAYRTGFISRSFNAGTNPFSYSPAAIVGLSQIDGLAGIYAGAPDNTTALAVGGIATILGDLNVGGVSTFSGAKTGYVADVFVNASGQRLRTGDIVTLAAAPIQRFWGADNKIPVAQVTLADQDDDPKVIGIVDREAMPAPGAPDTRTQPDDHSFIDPGGELFVVTLGAYSHCKVDASGGSIEIGDLLTTSSNPGFAKKASNPKLGTIIGKALEPLAQGTGYIAVFVNIQ